jgi:putative flippase GtrA
MAEARLGLRAHALTLSRYGLAGVANTAIGFGVITVLDAVLGAPPTLANAAGFAVGMLCSFMLNQRFVFRSQARLRSVGPKYMVAVALCFALNQAVLRAALTLATTRPEHLLGQLAGMVAYSGSLFLACRAWVFRAAPAE